MSAYTQAWCDVKDTREEDLRDRLHAALELLHEIRADLSGREGIDCETTDEIFSAIQELADEGDGWEEKLNEARGECEEEKSKLCKEYDELHTKLDTLKDELEKAGEARAHFLRTNEALLLENATLKAKLASIPTSRKRKTT